MAVGDRTEEGCAGETGISDELRRRLIFIWDREYGTYRAFDAGDGDGDGGVRSAEGVRCEADRRRRAVGGSFAGRGPCYWIS